MNYPFDFTFTSPGEYGVILNPEGFDFGTPVSNSAEPGSPTTAALLSLTAPPAPMWIVHLTITTDDNGDGKVTLGALEPDGEGGSVFYALYPVIATDSPGGGLVDKFDVGWKIPAGMVPALRYDGTSGGKVAGHIQIFKVG